MENEIRFSKYLESYKETVNELDLNIFLRLFVNHRPVYGISKNHITNALSMLGSVRADGTPFIMKDELIRILTTEGEKMTAEEIQECERILLGEGNALSDEIDPETLCHRILGFEDVDNLPEPEDDSTL